MDTTENADIVGGAENSEPETAPNAAPSDATIVPPTTEPPPAGAVGAASQATAAPEQEATTPGHPSPGRPPVGPGRTAAFFDLDKTIIAKSSALAFSRPFYQGGLINRRAVLKSAYAQFVFLVGGADHDQMEKMRQYLSALTRGWNVQQVREIVAETLHGLIDPIIYEEAAALIEQHHAAGRDVVIVSSSGAEVVEPIGALLGADHVIATRLAIEDGCYTGEIEYYAYAENKAAAIRELADREGYNLADSYAYSDSITDLPLLDAVGRPSAVNPDRSLRKEAVARDWPVLVFDRPIELHRRLPEFKAPSRSALVTIAVGTACVSAALVWQLAKRRRPAS
ncbi:HAD-IB family hydrolase [Kitasatospora sp. NBC_01287]|uniref:HAD family hydrolase n=1 Tax=Kitasatospora sp. NBC_01287 TaxID=2903573 RepID=UPI002258E545|nr:HAD-IB family hydrolase [Kitasatospora sp. NBC_01287]MCX4748122.1 HAD-IB family hydrolase [Kitasatospora sp. NBC_01287]